MTFLPPIDLDFDKSISNHPIVIEARQFLARKYKPVASGRYLVFDVEYVYDWHGQRRADRYSMDPQQPEKAKERTHVRWPFCQIACVVAMLIEVHNDAQISIDHLETWSRPELSESEIVTALTAFAADRGDAVPVTWGGEYKDMAVILNVAMRDGILLAPSLSNPHWKHGRIDLCDLLRQRSESVHLSEYAVAQGLPDKLMAPWELGEAAENKRWPRMREHCENDVTITAMLLLRWLITTGQLDAKRADVDAFIARTVQKLRPYRPALMANLAGIANTAPLMAAA